jgi:hypothetical protein
MDNRDPPDPPHDDFPESYETFWRENDDGELEAWGRTDRDNEFKLDSGSPEPVEGRCNATLRDYQNRYGERRYCGVLPAKNFPGYDSDYCRTHKHMDALEEHWQDLFKHGYFAESYVHVAQRLSPTKFLFAIEMLGGLMEMSQYEFDVAEEAVALDTSDSLLIQDDVVEVDMPVPTAHKFQADQLWQGSLAEVEMRQMRELVFKEGVETDTYAATADVDGEITDSKTEQTEHHLHLPISRLTKDIKEHLKNGGVEIDAEADSGTLTFQKNDYTLDVRPDEETASDDAQPVSEVGESFTEKLDADDESAVIEVDE